MELSSEEGVMPIPINSSYGGGHGHGHGLGHGHMIHHDPAPHNHIIPSSAPPPPPPQLLSNIAAPPMPTTLEDHMPYNNNNNNNNNNKKLQVVRYRECLKNHAAAMGGNATDGCGEFMPSGQEGTLEALICSACNCHRNFHRKETEGGHELPNSSSCDCYHSPHPNRINVGRKVILGHHKNMLGGPETLGYPTGLLIPSRGAVPHHHHSIVSYNIGGSLPSESDEQDDGGVVTRPYQLVKKRFRTKFSQEQKDKMLNFAEKVGWKIQKQEEAVVQQFCQEIGVKRRVLKVWMHNNKHNLAKKISPTTDQDQI